MLPNGDCQQMNRVLLKHIVGHALLLTLCLAIQGCGGRYRLSMPIGTGMESLAEEQYAQALLYMEASRYELAQQQFAIAEKTAVSPELRQLAHDGYTKAAGAIEAKR